MPSIVIAAAVGKKGLDKALVASQVVLSVILPIVSAPLIWFTSRKRIMTIPPSNTAPVMEGDETGRSEQGVLMQNGWFVTLLAVMIWLVLVIMNGSLLILLAMGKV